MGGGVVAAPLPNITCVSSLLDALSQVKSSDVTAALASCDIFAVAGTADEGHGDGDHDHHPHIIIPLGMFIMFASMLALAFHQIKQPPIIASIVIGIIGAIPPFQEMILPDLPILLVDAFVEVGFILVLFMGGMEVDLKSLGENVGKIGIFGGGQILLTFGTYMLFGYGFMPVSDGHGESTFTSWLFFGICMTLSSTILVIGTLNKRHALSENYGQIVLGIMVLQDVLAVTSLAILESLNPAKDVDIGISIVLIFAKLLLLIFVLALLSRFVLERVFSWFAVSEELTFLGTFGYCFGVAGICGLGGFSAEMGAFFAGVSVSALPYKIELENKAEPLKYFGVALFFIMLGFELSFTMEQFTDILPWALLLTFLTVIISPILPLLLGRVAGTLVRPNYYIGMIINQISEFSLVIAKLATKYKVFSEETFLLIAITCVFSLFVSALTHEAIDAFWQKIRTCLDKVDENRSSIVEQDHSLKFGHIIICEYTEVTQSIIDYYTETVKEEDIEITLITLNPQIQKFFAEMQADGTTHGVKDTTINGKSYKTRETILKKRTRGGGAMAMAVAVAGIEVKAVLPPPKTASNKVVPMDISEKSAIHNADTAITTDRSTTTPDNELLLAPTSEEEGKTSLRAPREGVVKVTCVYADMLNPIVWHHLHFDKAKLVVSTNPDCNKTNLALCRYLKGVCPFVPSTTQSREAMLLYENGADYVIQIDLLAANTVRDSLLPQIDNEQALDEIRMTHIGELKDLSMRLNKAFDFA